MPDYETIKLPKYVTRRGANSFRIKFEVNKPGFPKSTVTKTIHIPKEYNTAKKAETFLANAVEDMRSEYRKSMISPESCKMEDLIQAFFSSSQSKKTRTLAGYQDMVPRVLAKFEGVDIKRIFPMHIEEFLKELKKPSIRFDEKYIAKQKLFDCIDTCGRSHGYLRRELHISGAMIPSLYRGCHVEIETVRKFADYFSLRQEELFDVVTSGKGLSDKTVNNYLAFISSLFSFAVKNGLCHKNVCELVGKRKIVKERKNAIPDARIADLIQALEKWDMQYSTITFVILTLGCRRGEALGLCWKDIDFDKNSVSINKEVVYTPKSKTYVDTPKTYRTRTIGAPGELMKRLKAWKDRQETYLAGIGIEQTEDTFLFINEKGKNINPGTYSSALRSFRKKYGFDDIELNCLKMRHNHATRALAQGVAPVLEARNLGHLPSTTISTYLDDITNVVAENPADIVWKTMNK